MFGLEKTFKTDLKEILRVLFRVLVVLGSPTCLTDNNQQLFQYLFVVKVFIILRTTVQHLVVFFLVQYIFLYRLSKKYLLGFRQKLLGYRII